MNVAQKPLVDSQEILLPPLHMKLGIVKNFVKAMDKNGDDFRETDLERQIWLTVKAVINNLLGNTKTRNYKHLVNTMLQNF